MPFLILILVASAAGLAAGFVAWRYPRSPAAAQAPVLGAAEQVGSQIRTHPSERAFLTRRLSPATATELAVSLSLLFILAAGFVLGVLAFLIRTNSRLIGIDNGVAKWGNRHATPWSTHGLTAVTDLGNVRVVLALSLVLVLVLTVVERSRWIFLFVAAVIAGEELLQNAIKLGVDRTRPSFNPAAATLGPSFPSGHTTTAAAFFAAAALLLGRRRSRLARAALAGAAVGIAVGVAASRVLLDFHWLTDVVGGLLLGWAWFAVCGIAFGGRVLYFGAAAEVAAHAAEPSRPVRSTQPAPPHPPRAVDG